MQKVAFRTKIRLTIKYLNKIFKYKNRQICGLLQTPLLKEIAYSQYLIRKHKVTTIKAYSTQKKFEIKG